MTILKTFNNGDIIYYDKGNFDDYCVYIGNPSLGTKKAPRDIEYFTDLVNLKNIFGDYELYEDFVSLYNSTGKNVDPKILNDFIDNISAQYGVYYELVNRVFSILYLGMVAEENKAFTKLGKKVKRLGVHMVLKDNYTPYESANYTRGMKWYEIEKLCNSRGF